MSEVYQRGSIRKIERKNGFAWEWRYRVRGTMRQETFPVVEYKTEKALWRHLQSRLELLNAGEKPIVQVSPIATMGTLIQKYQDKYLPGLAKATQDTDGSMLRVHIIPRWETTLVPDVKAEAVEDWIKTLNLSSSSKGRARRLMKQLIDRAMFWEMLPHGANPITLVKVKGSTKREKKIILLTIDQVKRLIAALPHPYNTMVLVGASLGLRVEEIIPLRWDDFDWISKTVTIKRAYTHSQLKEPKTDASWTTLPVADGLIEALAKYGTDYKADSQWVFPSPVTGGCMSADTILAKKIKPVAVSLGLPHMGWHTLRHSYKSWQSQGAATLSQLKDLMRHSDISTTANIYGGTPVEDMRPYVNVIGDQLR